MNLLSICLALAGAYVAWVLDCLWGAVSGFLIGFLFGEVVELKRRIGRLEIKLSSDVSLSSLQKSPAEPTPAFSRSSSDADETDESLIFDPPEANRLEAQASEENSFPSETSASPAGFFQTETHNDISKSGPSIQALLRRYLDGSNLMVRAGVIILFFGIAFLVKYAAEQDLLPIELRLTAVAIFGMVLTLVGWHLRTRRLGYALALQGGGIGVLYLTIFGAAKLYALMPLLMALGVMILLVGVAAVLALLQNAGSLAILGTIGGFLAPVLTATGSGSHVMLFSYYLLLNIGILGIAWFKSWRRLNWVGFVFTFGIGAAWGGNSYKTDYFLTTELFLIAFFTIYFFISILFSFRQQVNLKGYVDSTLVFGLPLTAFGLQSALVKSIPFGLAMSAVGMAACYLIAAVILWRMKRNSLRLLVEAFWALGVMFATLAVPLAVSGNWTAGTWALEGGALFWIGIRQKQLLSRLAGLILLIGATLALVFILATSHASIVISAGILGLSCFWVSFLIQRHENCLKSWEKTLAPIILGCGLVWWMGGGLHQIDLMIPNLRKSQASVLFVVGSIGGLNWIASKLNWFQMRYTGLGVLPFMLFLAVYAFGHRIKADPFRDEWWIVWAFNFAVFYYLLKLNESFWYKPLLKFYHMAGGFLVIFLLTWDAAYWADYAIKSSETWHFAVWGSVPGLSALLLLNLHGSRRWPLRSFFPIYQHQMVAVILLYMLLWSLRICFEQADPRPLVYLPFLNPVDLVIIFMLLLTLKWNQKFSQQPLIDKWTMPMQLKVAVMGVFGCIWLTAVVIRTVHFWGQDPYNFWESVPYSAPTLATSALLQASLSVLWSLYAMGVLFISRRKGVREGWIAGAGLLAIVVIKLFLVDLSGSGTIARIVSFVGVGLLMLVIGYFSPLPPSIRKEKPL